MNERLTAVFAIIILLILLVNLNISTGKLTVLQTGISYMSALTELGFWHIHIKRIFSALFYIKSGLCATIVYIIKSAK